MSNRTKALSDQARDVLSRARVDTYRKPYPLVILDDRDKKLTRAVYQEVNAALETLGGKWHKGDQAHRFPQGIGAQSELSQRLADVVDTGSFQKPDRMGYFPTPLPIVEYLLHLAPVSQGHRVLEPSAGQGAIADEIRKIVPADQITLVEIQPQNAAVLRRKGYPEVHVCDFSDVPRMQMFDRILMNPPFERGQAVDHVTRAFEMLKRGGLLAAIMPISIMFRNDKRHTDFRRLVDDNGSVSALPDHAFRESGTDVKTVAVVLQK